MRGKATRALKLVVKCGVTASLLAAHVTRLFISKFSA